MRHTPSLVILLLLAAVPSSDAKVVRVDQGAPGAVQNGETWATAFRTVTAGLISAHPGDEVWVAKGVYAENVTVPGGVSLYGGFAGNETDRVQRAVKVNETVLDGGSTGIDTVVCNAQAIVVDGFHIRNGRNGVNVLSGTAMVNGNTITGSSYWGVAIAAGSDAVVSNCVVRGTLKCGVDVWGGTATLVNNTIVESGNYGVHVLGGGIANLTNNVIAFGRTAGVGVDDGMVAGCSSNNVYGNPAGPWYGYTPPDGYGNITLDPLFVDRANGNLRLRPGSPCIDAGDDGAAAGDTDLDGAFRWQGDHMDIGAYEYAPPVPFTLKDVTACLSAAGGLAPCPAGDVSRLNVVSGNSCLDIADALRIARKVAGLEPNP